MTHPRNTPQVGIIGDGQLALMLAESLIKMKVSFLCLSVNSESPMHTFFPDNITADRDRFKNECTIFTLENEFHTIQELQNLLGEKTNCLFPEIESYSFFADKISQRLFYANAGITSPQWMPLRKESDLITLKLNFNFPYVVKTSHGGYDGKGVRIVHNETELSQALLDFNFHNGQHLLVEEKVHIIKEVAQGFLRNKDGLYTLLPLVETIQENGICNLVQYPPNVSPNTQAQIEFFLERLIATNLVGIFNFEFFIDSNNRVVINEGAPRTHNSQHLTLDASLLSQFDLLALYLTNPKGVPKKIMTKPSVMINLLGKTSGPCGHLRLPEISSLKFRAKLYGKVKCAPGRKMGHVNVIDDDGRADLLAVGKKIFKEYEL
jgi:5-(carboxyamino)imidazole ribonucleotide synthase